MKVGQTKMPRRCWVGGRSGEVAAGNLEADDVAGGWTSGLNLGLLWCGIQHADALQLVR